MPRWKTKIIGPGAQRYTNYIPTQKGDSWNQELPIFKSLFLINSIWHRIPQYDMVRVSKKYLQYLAKNWLLLVWQDNTIQPGAYSYLLNNYDVVLLSKILTTITTSSKLIKKFLIKRLVLSVSDTLNPISFWALVILSTWFWNGSNVDPKLRFWTVS